MSTSESVYKFAFKFEDIYDGNDLITVDETNPVIQGYSGRSALIGDAAFYVELNRVLGNLRTIRAAHPNIKVLISYVFDANGNSFEVTLV